MVLRSKSVGEQDVLDQQGSMFVEKDLVCGVLSFLVTTAFVFSTSLFEFEILHLRQIQYMSKDCQISLKASYTVRIMSLVLRYVV